MDGLGRRNGGAEGEGGREEEEKGVRERRRSGRRENADYSVAAAAAVL